MELSLLYKNGINELVDVFTQDESKAIITRLISDYYGFSQTDILLNKEIDNFDDILFAKQLERLKKQEPIQHVVGFEIFCNRKFNVSCDVLIPRPETEELINIIKNHINGNSYKILDIGTGSGAIAISIALECPKSEVFAIDISPKALKIARQNSANLGAKVEFIEADILNENIDIERFDIIVSNPPYVTNSEKKLMQNNVLNFEPHLALFVEDSSPLIFYSRITNIAKERLNDNGALFFEINEAYGKEVAKLLEYANFEEVTIIKDFNDKDRFVWGIKKKR